MGSDPIPRNGTASAPITQEHSAKRVRSSISFENRIRILCFVIAAPGFLLAALLLWRAQFSWPVATGLLGGIILFALIAAGVLLEQIVRPLQTLANVVAALRESDFSFRAYGGRRSGALGELALEINSFADMLQSQRVGELEATALLRCVVSSMDAPVLAFDPANRLRLINPAAERVFGLATEHALGSSADDLELGALLDQPDQGIFVLAGKADPGRWMVRRSSFRQLGVPHALLVLSDVSIALREQERDAWRRLIRVLGHEINNSLTPIKSIACSLRSRLQLHSIQVQSVETSGKEGAVDLERGLSIIESRAESLNRFIQAYRQLAQLPPPAFQPVSLRAFFERVMTLENRVSVHLLPGPDLMLRLDPDLMEQLMINLLRNSAEAVLARFAGTVSGNAQSIDTPDVSLTWRASTQDVEILVQDNGIGLINPSNLFVPFYTTKPGGSGIGLALARQICEAHGGVLQLSNRPDAPGCQAEIRLPLNSSQESLPTRLDRKTVENEISVSSTPRER